MATREKTSVRTICPIPTKYGDANLISFHALDKKEHVAISFGDNLSSVNPVNVRIHSECATSEIFGSLKCDCAEQLEEAMELAASTNGIVLYLKQEGRGIGLYNKIDAYKLQAEGLDTIEANRALNLPDDSRDFSIAANMLKAMGVEKVNLLTNNPEKIQGLIDCGIEVAKRIPTGVFLTDENKGYLKVKVNSCGHMIDVNKRAKSYIGVSGIKDFHELTTAYETSSLFTNDLKKNEKEVILGLSCHFRELENQLRFSEIHQILSRYVADKYIKTSLHLSFKDVKNEREAMQSICSKFLFADSIQINDYKNLETIIDILLDRKLIIPIYDENNNDALLKKNVVEIVNNSNSFLLLDNSKGRGIVADKSDLQSKILFYSSLGYKNIAIAGGLGPNSLSSYHDLKLFNISLDAETKLKKNGKLDSSKVQRYLTECLSSNEASLEDQVG